MDLHRLVNENQSIKIVPSIEESLRTGGLNFDLDVNATDWLVQLKKTWTTWKKSSTTEQFIITILQSRSDPYRIALAMVIKCEDFKDCKPKTLPFCIIETLSNWALQNKLALDESLKLPAFKIAIRQRNQHFLSLIAQTYQLTTIKADVLPIVQDIIEDGNHKQATQIVIALDLFNDISVEDLLFPLILQDKSNLIDDYLSECPNQIKPFLLFMDRLLDKKTSIREFAQKYIEKNKITEIRYDKLHYKPLGKLVARLCSKFKIPIETCKNLSKNRTTGGLRYLIHQKYVEHKVSSSVWEDLIKDSLKQNVESGPEFIDMLSEHDTAEALKWAQYLNIPEDDYPPNIKQTFDKVTESEDWDEDTSEEFYKLSLPQERVIMVDSGEAFYDMVKALSNCRVVCIDCEWKPSFGATQSQVALIQLANCDSIYLVDTLLLNRKEYSSFWYSLHKSVLDNAEIIKVGFGLECDLREIKGCIIGLSNIKVKGEGLLDIAILWKNLVENGLIIPGGRDNNGNGLSSIVHCCFGLPLAKSEQCSNWELRPLRSTQVEYAALDAHVLLEIYNFLQKLCFEQKINFEEICNDIMLEGKQKSIKKPKVIDSLQASTTNCVQVKSASEIKFLLDPNLSWLIAYLRYCGFDSDLISSSMLWHDVINYAISEDRYILIPKCKLSPTNRFPQSNILEVGKMSFKDQVHKIINYFQINLADCKILSLCIYCNGKNLKKLMHNEIKTLYNDYCESNKTDNFNINNYNQVETNYDGFLSDSDCDEELYQPMKNTPKKITTSKGAAIDIDAIKILHASKENALLCETCGRLLWDNEELVKTICNTFRSIQCC